MDATRAIMISSSPPSGQISRTGLRPPSLSPSSKCLSVIALKEQATPRITLASITGPIHDAAVIDCRSATAFTKEPDSTLSYGAIRGADAVLTMDVDALVINKEEENSGLMTMEAAPEKKASKTGTNISEKLPVCRIRTSPLEKENLQNLNNRDHCVEISENNLTNPAEPELQKQHRSNPRKPRKKRETADAQSRLAKGKLSKPGVKPAFELKEFIDPRILNSDKACQEPIPSLVATLCQMESSTPEEELRKRLELFPALERQNLWTSPGITGPQLEGSIESIREEIHGKNSIKDDVLAIPDVPAPFSNLEDQFGYIDRVLQDSPISIIRSRNGEPTTKRPRLEVADRPVSVKESKKSTLKKVKAPAKSSRTITGIAIANLHSPEKSRFDTPIPFHAIFELQPSEKLVGCSTTVETSGKEKKRATKRKAIATAEGPQTAKKNIRKTKKKVIINVAKVLSPGTAMRKIARQGLLFGTSSQITREESPSFIRDLQQALKESESTLQHDSFSPPDARRTTNLRSLVTEPRLWFAASRDDAEYLLPVETMEERQKNLLPTEMDNGVQPPTGEEFLNIDTIPMESTNTFSVKNAEEELPKAQVHDRDFVSIDALQQEYEKNAAIGHVAKSYLEAPIFLPNFSQYSSLEERPGSVLKLSTAKSQPKKMIQRLDNAACGASEPSNSRVLQPLAVNTTMKKASQNSEIKAVVPALKNKRATGLTDEVSETKPSTDEMKHTTAKKPRGRPPKDPNLFFPPPKRKRNVEGSNSSMTSTNTKDAGKLPKKWCSIDEIEDSEPEPTSSPPRRRSAVAPQALELSQPLPLPKASLDCEATQVSLFSQITKAVKSMPRTKDLAHPTWLEKMLMYDPIVLEDLTAWLNTGALYELGGREEKTDIKASVVQKWCEENSICCLWREGLRGGVKARY